MADLFLALQDESVQARFWAKVDVRGPDDCWEWQAACDEGGYGRFYVATAKRTVGAHSCSAIIEYGNKPQGLITMHACDNPPCVNPKHLSFGTHAQNAQDMVTRGRHFAAAFTHCPNGHPYAGENLVMKAISVRACRQCRAEQTKRWRNKVGPRPRSERHLIQEPISYAVTPSSLAEAIARVEDTIHQNSGHWWNRGDRPRSRDLRVLLDAVKRNRT